MTVYYMEKFFVTGLEYLNYLLVEHNSFCFVYHHLQLELFYNHDEMYKKTFEYRNTLWNIENIEKPLLSVSSYKLQQLIDIANKLKINIMKQLYHLGN